MTEPELENYEFFAMKGEKMIHDEGDIGIINGMLTGNGPYRNAMMIRGLYAPPFVSSDFCLEVRLFGEKVKASRFKWYPAEIVRYGKTHGLRVDSYLVGAAGRRAFIMQVKLTNTTAEKFQIPLQIGVDGTLDYNSTWEFNTPRSSTGTDTKAYDNGMLLYNIHGIIAIDTTIPGLTYCAYSQMLEGVLDLGPNAERTFTIAVAIGYDKDSVRQIALPQWATEKKFNLILTTAETDAAALVANPELAVEDARRHFAVRVEKLRQKLPDFHSSYKPLNKWYSRSLVHLLLNQWIDVPEFFLNPYFSTGSLNGGCCCSYLWDFGANWKIWGLYDPEATKRHIKAFLNIDLGHHYAFTPLDGSACGPWYYINQEKIIFCIYYYVLHTGDTAFLHEYFNGRTIIEHVVEQALLGDELDKDANMVDYGTGNHHLELQKKYHYDNFLPDMNLRRISYYYAAASLCRLAGHQAPVDFRKRADALQSLVSQELYDAKEKWFQWRDATGKRSTRYTIQMFKTFGFPKGRVLTEEQRQALLSHLNDEEFLGEYGMHSMAKHDPAYHQADIDNGGGGACIFFAPEIAEKLYADGEKALAEKIIKRLFWWAERMPFWGDSVVANYIDYRKNTPLQNAIGGAAISSCVIFGIFGISVTDKFEIVVNPNPPTFTPEMELRNLRLAGHVLDIAVKAGRYRIAEHGKTIVQQTVGIASVIK